MLCKVILYVTVSHATNLEDAGGDVSEKKTQIKIKNKNTNIHISTVSLKRESCMNPK